MQVIGDFAVVWLLSPRRDFQPPPTRRMAKALAALPAHCLQVCMDCKCVLSGCIRMHAGLVPVTHCRSCLCGTTGCFTATRSFTCISHGHSAL